MRIPACLLYLFRQQIGKGVAIGNYVVVTVLLVRKQGVCCSLRDISIEVMLSKISCGRPDDALALRGVKLCLCGSDTGECSGRPRPRVFRKNQKDDNRSTEVFTNQRFGRVIRVLDTASLIIRRVTPGLSAMRQ